MFLNYLVIAIKIRSVPSNQFQWMTFCCRTKVLTHVLADLSERSVHCLLVVTSESDTVIGSGEHFNMECAPANFKLRYY